MTKKISNTHLTNRFNKFANKTKKKNKVAHFSRGGYRL